MFDTRARRTGQCPWFAPAIYPGRGVADPAGFHHAGLVDQPQCSIRSHMACCRYRKPAESQRIHRDHRAQAAGNGYESLVARLVKNDEGKTVAGQGANAARSRRRPARAVSRV